MPGPRNRQKREKALVRYDPRSETHLPLLPRKEEPDSATASLATEPKTNNTPKSAHNPRFPHHTCALRPTATTIHDLGYGHDEHQNRSNRDDSSLHAYARWPLSTPSSPRSSAPPTGPPPKVHRCASTTTLDWRHVCLLALLSRNQVEVPGAPLCKPSLSPSSGLLF